MFAAQGMSWLLPEKQKSDGIGKSVPDGRAVRDALFVCFSDGDAQNLIGEGDGEVKKWMRVV